MLTRFLKCLIVILGCFGGMFAQTAPTDAEGRQWWQHAVFYEIYPRSFADSNNNGIGDLNGITSKLDYLKDLGVDAIWITPCYPSPQVDFGYDVSDYENIDPMYGTLKDFDRLASEARKRGIRIIMDFVMNHSSDKHKWVISGFRLDAVDTLFEDPDLRDNPILPGTNKYGDPNMEDKYNTKLPELHDVLRDLRKVADEHSAVLIGETWTKDIDELKRYYGDHSNELQMPMDFLFARVDKLSPAEFRKQIAGVDAAVWPVYVLSNHDIVRAYNRYGDGQHNDQIAKVMAGLYLTLRGTPIMYYGEEIGMENNDPKRKEDVKDPIGKIGWPKEKGRDGERTPMQWNDSTNAGFSQPAPWLPVPPSYKTHNVPSDLKDPDAILQ